MTDLIPQNHSLRLFFEAITHRSFYDRLGWHDLRVANYVANLLVDFTHTDNLFKIRNARGYNLKEVGEMLLEADVLLEAGSFEREREVHRHIADFTLFMVGIFPEYLRRIKTRQLIHHPDFLIDYVKVGKKSYHNVSEFDYGDFKNSVPLFRKLSENFEICVVVLGYVRAELEQMKNAQLHQAEKILLN